MVRLTVFDGFALREIATPETALRVRIGGEGPPLLLLHGFPQTHAMWHLVAPALARRFTVVAPDLRGYGGSGKPATAADHEPYSKRAMARDCIALMEGLGFARFAIAGHDRGGRVAYRAALDHPDRITKLAVLDIIPTGEVYRTADARVALGYWHWFFLPQPADLPERMLAVDPLFLMRSTTLGRRIDIFAPEALAEYERYAADPAVRHAWCEDYRAGATFDRALDDATDGKEKIAAPTLALWGARGAVGAWYDPLEVWHRWCHDVRGRALDCGHYLAEEAPAETTGALMAFFAGDD